MKQLISKSADELKQAVFIVMVPDEPDLHGDITSAAEIQKACHNFNKFCRQPNLFHVSKTDSFEFAESYIAPVDFTIGEEVIKAGTWLANVQFLNDDLWQAVKDGEISGLSIGALAVAEDLTEE
jgi:hypothetical protein